MKMGLGYCREEGGKQIFKLDSDGTLLGIVEADNAQFAVIKSWNKVYWDKENKALIGNADLELLDKLAHLVRLPKPVEDRRVRLRAVQDAVDRERVNQDPKPFCQYPVKMPLYAHQVRGANMALLTFGWVQPKRNGTT